jgi:hypothetical protein
MAARRGADDQQKRPVAPQVLPVAPPVLAEIVRLADATNGRLLADPWRLAAILHRHGYDVPTDVQKTLAARAANRKAAHTLKLGGWWTILLDPTSWPLMCEVIIEVRAALPIGYQLGDVLLWGAGVPTVRQQRARARAIRCVRAELLQVRDVSSDEAAAWWKPDYPMPPDTWSAKERTAFTVRRMQFHLVHEEPLVREEPPRDDERAPDTTSQPEVVQSRLTLKRQRGRSRTERRAIRRP